MNDLSDDLSEWPQNPFDILAIDSSATELDIRRAYMKRIRRFRPEQYPKHFQRLREAFEECQAVSLFGSGFTLSSEPLTAPRRPENTPEEYRANTDDDGTAWALAAIGNWSGAYELLLKQIDGDASAESAVQLYWLLQLDPTLDPTRRRHDWLAQALRRSKVKGVSVDLYEAESLADPAFIFLEPYSDLWKWIDHETDYARIAKLRLDAIGEMGHFDLIEAEIERHRTEFPNRSELQWLTWLTNALHWVAFAPACGPVRKQLYEEIENESALAIRYPQLFDHAEQSAFWSYPHRFVKRENSRPLRMGEHKPNVLWKKIPVEFAECLHYAATRGESLDRLRLQEGMRIVAKSPKLFLTVFDELQTEYGPAFPSNLYWIMDPLSPRRPCPLNEQQLIVEMIALFDDHHPDRILRTRLRLLYWLIENRIHPDDVCSIVHAQPTLPIADSYETLETDWPLRIVWVACDIADLPGDPRGR
jgi:hypothetical protein